MSSEDLENIELEDQNTGSIPENVDTVLDEDDNVIAGEAPIEIPQESFFTNLATVLDEQTVAIGSVANPMRQTDSKKLYVGKDLGKEMSETIKVDNLGFCKNIGTKAEMTARAAALYNSGDGLACNNSGK